MNGDNVNWVLLGMASLSLATGLLLHMFLVRSGSAFFFATNVISSLLIALFPVLVIFSFFPSSTFNATLKGASMGGAIGAFIFIWWYGNRAGIAAVNIDNDKQRIRTLEATEQELRQNVLRLEEELKKSQTINNPKTTPNTLRQSQSMTYKLQNERLIILFTDSIEHLTTADIWVNSENTNMQMAGFYDRSISGAIRYLGADKDPTNAVLNDSIQDALTKQLGPHKTVAPRTVLCTTSGAAQKSNNVKVILHVAAVFGQVGFGYRPIAGIHNCVSAVLKRTDAEDIRELDCRSIAIPLFGIGTARGDLKAHVSAILDEALRYLSDHPENHIEKVYFLTWYDTELRACSAVLDKDERVTRAGLSA